MSWEDIDDKVKKAIDRDYVSCSEDYELNYIKAVLRQYYGNAVSEKRINDAITHCCNKIKGNRPREEFSRCIADELG